MNSQEIYYNCSGDPNHWSRKWPYLLEDQEDTWEQTESTEQAEIDLLTGLTS